MAAQIVEFTWDELDVIAHSFRILGDPSRLRVVWFLLEGEHSVNEIAEGTGINPPAVSQHLAKLRLSGLVSTRRDGNHIIYELVSNHVRALVNEAMLHGEHLVDPNPRHHRKDKRAKHA